MEHLVNSSQSPRQPRRPALGTRAIHAGQTPDPATGALMTPIYTSSTYVHQSPGVHKGFDYGRTQNPTRFALERCVADLEDGKAGFAFASGLAACSTTLELLDHGAHVLVCDDLYGGTYRLFEQIRRRTAKLDFSYLDAADLAAMEAAIRPQTRMVWMESPSNPLMKLADLEGIAALAKRHGLLSVIDNTFASPYCQRPLTLGFDLVLHSTTKYINGHSDIIGGLVVVGDNAELEEKMRFLAERRGGHRRALRLLSRPAGTENLPLAHGAALPERPGDCPLAPGPARRSSASSIRGWKAIRSTPWPGGR